MEREETEHAIRIARRDLRRIVRYGRVAAALADLLGGVEGEVQRGGGRSSFDKRSFAGCNSLLLTGPPALLFRLTMLLRIHVRHIPCHWFKLPVTVTGANLFPRRWLPGADTLRLLVVHVITGPITVGPIAPSSRCSNVGAALLLQLRWS